MGVSGDEWESDGLEGGDEEFLWNTSPLRVV